MNAIREPHRPRVLGIVAVVTLLIVLAVGGWAGAGAAAAQDQPLASPTPVPATVFVNGQGTVTFPPDTASVVVGVDVERPTLDAAQTVATEQQTAIIDAARAGGIA